MENNDINSGQGPMNQLFDLSKTSEEMIYGLGFDKASQYLRDVLRKMSDYVGWKDRTRSYDFYGFSGFYPVLNDQSASIYSGEKLLASFTPLPGGRLGFEAFGKPFTDYPKDVNPWYPLGDIMNGRFCLEKQNLDMALEETHHGQEVIYGLRYGEDTAVCCRPDDAKLRSAVVAAEPSIIIVDADKFGGALVRWMEKDAVPGFESEVRPEMIRYVWDGDSLRSEKELADDLYHDIGDLSGRWEALEALRSEGDKIRLELEKKVGIEDGVRFRFKHALYPSLGIRDDALFLSSNCGKGMGDFLTVGKEGVGMYRGYSPFGEGLSKPVRVFDSLFDALSTLRKTVLGEKNITLAKKDYQAYKQSQEQSQSKEQRSGVKLH